MAAIDLYKHQLLGFIDCPATHDFVYNSKTRKIALYQLEEDIPSEEKNFDGKKGDLILGGGSGEAPAMRISIDKCFKAFIYEEDVDFAEYSELFKAFWSPTQSFIYGEGFIKCGWFPTQSLEVWLIENICRLLQGAGRYEKYREDLYTASALSWSNTDV